MNCAKNLNSTKINSLCRHFECRAATGVKSYDKLLSESIRELREFGTPGSSRLWKYIGISTSYMPISIMGIV